MGLFNLFGKKKSVNDEKIVEKPIPEEDKKYYKEDEYYQKTIYEGTGFEKTVVTFEERKKTAKPSRNGLYPAEILLLEYCKKGEFPEPKKGYQGFWWFEYGIRNVGEKLKSLEDRNFIKMGKASNSLNNLTVSTLKDILSKYNLPVSGKKADLIERVSKNVSEENLISLGVKGKYCLTDYGKEELEENEYVAYVHKSSSKTLETKNYKNDFNVWSLNRIINAKNKENWKEIVDKQKNKIEERFKENYKRSMESLKKIDLDLYRKLKAQDDQLDTIQKRDAQYKKDKDIESYIQFWELLWKNEGLLFVGAYWAFLLPDLYIKEKKYKEALDFVYYIKLTQDKNGYYTQKADKYIENIMKKIKKQKPNK